MLRSTSGLASQQVKGASLRDLLRDGRLYIYSGGQPVDPDGVPTGTLGVVFTLDAETYTDPVKATVDITLSGAQGAVSAIKVGGMAFNLLTETQTLSTTLADLATAIAADINSQRTPMNITAEAVGAVVTLSLPFWMGADGNGLTCATTVTAEIGDDLAAAVSGGGLFAGGVTAVNGLNFDFPATGGIISKPSGEAWRGEGENDITAGWFRFVAGGSTVNGDGATNIRFDGTLATSGGDLDAGTLTILAGAMQTIGRLELEIPQSE